jgi:hypothetical protein
MDRFRLWSLLDVQAFDAAKLTTIVAEFMGAASMLMTASGQSQFATATQLLREKFNGLIEVVGDHPPTSYSLNQQCVRLRDAIQNMTWEDRETVATLVVEYIRNLNSELGENVFLYIDDKRRVLYEQPEPPLGEAVSDTFGSDANYEIAAAARCLAFDQPTASVFHLMRATEIALQRLARRFKIKNVTIKEWHNLLQDIDTALAALRQEEAHGPARSRASILC